MMELSKKIEKVLEKHDFCICGEIIERYGRKGEYDVDLETYSPEGENVIVSLIYDGTEENFIAAFAEYANWFDAENHAEEWICLRGKNGVPESIKDLLEDAEWIKTTLLKVAEELNNLDEKSEELNSMNIGQFYNYVLKKFNISEDAGKLVTNILQFVKENYTDGDKQYRSLCDLLNGVVEISDQEVRMINL